MVGMGSVVTRDAPPFTLVAGNPARFMRINHKGLEAAGLAPDAVIVNSEGILNHSAAADRFFDRFATDIRRDIVRADRR